MMRRPMAGRPPDARTGFNIASPDIIDILPVLKGEDSPRSGSGQRTRPTEAISFHEGSTGFVLGT